MEFKESTEQTEVTRHRYGQTCTLTSSLTSGIWPLLSLCLYFPVLVPPQTTRSLPFPAFGSFCHHLINSLVQSLNAPSCIPHWVPYLCKQYPLTVCKVAGMPSSIMANDDWSHSQPMGQTPSWDDPGRAALGDSFPCLSSCLCSSCVWRWSSNHNT